jgi:hypothetical protein
VVSYITMPEVLMTMLLLQQILTGAPAALPRLFLFGAPVLLIALAVAAFIDTRIPWTSTGEHPVHPSSPPPSR